MGSGVARPAGMLAPRAGGKGPGQEAGVIRASGVAVRGAARQTSDQPIRWRTEPAIPHNASSFAANTWNSGGVNLLETISVDHFLVPTFGGFRALFSRK